MLRFRPKMATDRSKEWRCCMCMHVRTGTILLGSWHLMLHLFALGFLAAVVRDPSLMQDFEQERETVVGWRDVGSALPTPLSNIEPPPNSYPQYGLKPKDQAIIYHDVDVGALVTICTLAITLMLIYGASRGKPAHLLPFFCLQIFDFAITVMTGTGYLCYVRSIHRLVAEARHVPWRAQLLSLPAPMLASIILFSFLLAMLIKAYFINMVWRCYKYLSLRSHSLRNLTPFVISSEGAVSPLAFPAAPAPHYSSLLPDYEEAVKQTPPPSYRAATLMAADPTLVAQPNNETEQIPSAPAVTPPVIPPATNTIVVLPQDGAQARV
ncbi:lysosomal-associated transmembrane protein 4A isoform X2 [Leptidea sinapis]|nr:lysosomal-associated transmembrane protein 4A isoform X2 [Leptidea sinapis]XP_050679843.1 lysosomal-associated transmembrane protein 4A isoform X2 [Leptidea sinapis]